MSSGRLAQLRRLGLRQPRTRQEALAVLDDVIALRRGLVAERDTVSRELARLRLNLDAAQAYRRAKGRTQ